MQTQPIELLFIEDDLDFSKSIVARLERRNIKVTAVESAEAALEVLDECEFDVIVSDIKLGGMSGIDFLGHVKNIDEHLPVILLTGLGNLQTARDAVEMNAFNYLLKPLQNIEDLIIPIKDAVKSYTVIKEIIYLKEYYHAIIENIPCGIITFDRDKRIEEINNAFNKIFRMIDNNLTGQPHTVFEEFLTNKICDLKSKNEDKFEYIIDNDTIGNVFLKNLNINDKENALMVISELDITGLSHREKEVLFRLLKQESEDEIGQALMIDAESLFTYRSRIQSKLRGKVDLSLWKKMNQAGWAGDNINANKGIEFMGV